MSLPTIAIAGASGHLGRHITAAVTSTQFSCYFSKVVLLTRKDPSEFASTSATPSNVVSRQYNEADLTGALHDVNILVDAVGPAGHSFKERIARVIPQTPVHVYFPSEFGVDHYIHDFPHPEWNQKKKHLALCTQLFGSKVKICNVFCGLFLEDSIGPWFGFDTKNAKYDSVGLAGTPISFTALDDTGKTVARLATLPAEEIPNTVHISGDTKSFREIADCMTAAGGGKIEINELDLKEFKEKAVTQATSDPAPCLRFLMGEGKIDHTVPGGLGNNNAVVNPGENLWKWKSMMELGNATGGRPWSNVE